MPAVPHPSLVEPANSLRRQVGYNIGAQGLRILSTFVITGLVLRSLDAHNVALYLLAQSAAMISSRLVVFGLNRSVVAAAAEGIAPATLIEETSKALLVNAARVVLVIPAMALGLWLAGLHSAQLIPVTLLVFAWAVVSGSGVVFAEVARSRDQLVWPALLQGINGGLAAGVLNVVALLGLVIFGHFGLIAAIASTVVAITVPVGLYLSQNRRTAGGASTDSSMVHANRTGIDQRWLRDRGREAGRAQLATVIGADLDLWVVGLLLGPVPAASYGLAKRLAAQFGLVPHVVATSAMPRVISSVVDEEPERYRQGLFRSAVLSSLVAGIGVLAVALFLEPTLRLAGSTVVDNVVPLTLLLAVPSIALAVTGSPGYLLQALPDSDICRMLNVRALLLAALCLPIIATSGPTEIGIGVALTHATIWGFVVLAEWQVLQRLYGLDSSIIRLSRGRPNLA